MKAATQIVAWTIVTETFRNGKHEKIHTDHWQPFTEFADDGLSPQGQAHELYQKLVGEIDFAENETLYVASICEITASTDYDTVIDEEE